MSTNWISRLGRRITKLFSWQVPEGYYGYEDRDAERVARELELIRLRFPHHS